MDVDSPPTLWCNSPVPPTHSHDKPAAAAPSPRRMESRAIVFIRDVNRRGLRTAALLAGNGGEEHFAKQKHRTQVSEIWRHFWRSLLTLLCLPSSQQSIGKEDASRGRIARVRISGSVSLVRRFAC